MMRKAPHSFSQMSYNFGVLKVDVNRAARGNGRYKDKSLRLRLEGLVFGRVVNVRVHCGI